MSAPLTNKVSIPTVLVRGLLLHRTCCFFPSSSHHHR